MSDASKCATCGQAKPPVPCTECGQMQQAIPAPAQPQIHIDMDEATAMGQYTNIVLLNHTAHEFTLDAIYLQPNQPRARVRSRLIMSPNHMKRLLLAMQANVDQYEQKFGEITVPENDPTPNLLQ